MGNRYGLSFLKKVCVALCIGMILHSFTQAQCVGNLSLRTYDTTLTSNGFAVFNLSFPQWSADSGTLVSVKLTAMVSSQYGFTLRNADSVATTYALTVGQQDQFSSPTLDTAYSSIVSQSMGSYPLNPGQSVSQAPFSFLSNHIASDSLTAVAPFLGAGRVSLNYKSFTFTNLNAVNHAAYYYSAGIANNMTFSVEYLYCRNGVAPDTLATRNRLYLYPNPTVDYINLVPDQQTAGDWQVDILSADGHLVQRNAYLQTHSMLITFQHKLSAGTYFVRATDLRGHKASSASFEVTGH